MKRCNIMQTESTLTWGRSVEILTQRHLSLPPPAHNKSDLWTPRTLYLWLSTQWPLSSHITTLKSHFCPTAGKYNMTLWVISRQSALKYLGNFEGRVWQKMFAARLLRIFSLTYNDAQVKLPDITLMTSLKWWNQILLNPFKYFNSVLSLS